MWSLLLCILLCFIGATVSGGVGMFHKMAALHGDINWHEMYPCYEYCYDYFKIFDLDFPEAVLSIVLWTRVGSFSTKTVLSA